MGLASQTRWSRALVPAGPLCPRSALRPPGHRLAAHESGGCSPSPRQPPAAGLYAAREGCAQADPSSSWPRLVGRGYATRQSSPRKPPPPASPPRARGCASGPLVGWPRLVGRGGATRQPSPRHPRRRPLRRARGAARERQKSPTRTRAGTYPRAPGVRAGQPSLRGHGPLAAAVWLALWRPHLRPALSDAEWAPRLVPRRSRGCRRAAGRRRRPAAPSAPRASSPRSVWR